MSMQNTCFTASLLAAVMVVWLSSCFSLFMAIRCVPEMSANNASLSMAIRCVPEMGANNTGCKPPEMGGYNTGNPKQMNKRDEHIHRQPVQFLGEEPKTARTKTKTNVFINVNDFGAKGDGITDDSKAFMKAWKMACSTKNTTLVVPARKKYYLKPITFKGPCKGVTINIEGTLIASKEISDYSKNRHDWIKLEGVNGLSVVGGGTLDGNGHIWWPKSCKRDKTQPCKHAPTALTFADCTEVKVEGLNVKNAQQMHMIFQGCKNVQASNIMLNSPGDSPNTDGIHVSETKNIVINQCDIQTGDDCISIVNGSHQVKAKNIKCGPGHGISVGSLGKNGGHAIVSNIFVDKATISNTENGVRIKTWQGGSGIAENIAFQNIFMHNVTNAIIIDQYYCDKNGKTCNNETQAVHVKNVVYKNIHGTSAKKEGVILKCSKSYPCEGIKLENVELLLYKEKKEHTSTIATCLNAKVQQTSNVSPRCPN